MNGTTITFPVQQVNNEETIQLILNIFHEEVIGMRAWNSDDYRIKVANWGDINMDYEIEENLLLPSNVMFEFDDLNHSLGDLLFGQSALALSVDKEIEAIIKINGIERIKATAIPGKIRCNPGKGKVKLTVGTRTDILNKKPVYFRGGTHTFRITAAFTNFPQEGSIYSNNGSQFTVVGVIQVEDGGLRIATNRTSGLNNPLSADWLTKVSGNGDVSYQYASWWTGYGINHWNYSRNTYRSIVSILENIYSIVDSSISYSGGILDLHSWQMQGNRDSAECYLNNIRLPETYILTDPLFFDDAYQIKSFGDMLKKLAIDWGAFTGMLSNGKAFFKQLFNFNAANTQAVKINKWEQGYELSLIDYVRVTTGINSPNEPYTKGIYTPKEDRILERKSLPGFYITASQSGSNVKAVINRSNHFVFDHGSAISNYPSEGSVYSNNSSEFEVVGTPFSIGSDVSRRITTIRIAGTNNPDASGTLIKVSGTGDTTYSYSSYGDANGTYTIYRARDPILDYPGYQNVFKDHGDLMSAFWFFNRGNIQKCRIDSFTFWGIGYDFMKDFIHSGLKFQIISMTIRPSQSLTDVKALFLGAV
ncbi:MAG: hypothetical protein AB1432_05465 [Bacteroidota bacterium]